MIQSCIHIIGHVPSAGKPKAESKSPKGWFLYPHYHLKQHSHHHHACPPQKTTGNGLWHIAICER
jgi:hypothetical protein